MALLFPVIMTPQLQCRMESPRPPLQDPVTQSLLIMLPISQTPLLHQKELLDTTDRLILTLLHCIIWKRLPSRTTLSLNSSSTLPSPRPLSSLKASQVDYPIHAPSLSPNGISGRTGNANLRNGNGRFASHGSSTIDTKSKERLERF